MASNKSKQKNVTQAADASQEPAKAITLVYADQVVPTAPDTEKLVEDELARCYPEHVKYPTSTGLLQCVLKELIRQRIGR